MTKHHIESFAAKQREAMRLAHEAELRDSEQLTEAHKADAKSRKKPRNGRRKHK